MSTELIHDRGRGPEIKGTRITVYNLLPYFLDSNSTEEYICKVYGLSPEQVSAARAYVFNHAETVLSEHLQIESRLSAGNPPDVVEAARRTHATFVQFREWLVQQTPADPQRSEESSRPKSLRSFPSFREWLAEQEARPQTGT
jgi:uncharacterized protein (DUF433 family)